MALATHYDGHAGQQTVGVLRGFGSDVMFTLNGGHIWPFYEAARDQGVRVVDTRHEQTATFAAEGWAKLTRRPGLAALTAGPGVTNAVSAITTAQFNGTPMVVVGGRAPQRRWGAGSLQEIDHLPIVDSITKLAATVTEGGHAARLTCEAASVALTPHRGPVFLDFPLDVFRASAGEIDAGAAAAADVHALGRGDDPDPDAVSRLAAALAQARRPAMIVGSDAYWADAAVALRAAVERLRIPCFFNGLGRGLLPPDHELAFQRTRGMLKGEADLVVVVGAPLDFRLGFGRFGAATIAHVVDSVSQRAAHVDALSAQGSIAATLAGLANHAGATPDHEPWIARLRSAEVESAGQDRALLEDDRAPIRPGRIYGELIRRLDHDAVVICDGGDFASYAGKLVPSWQPGCWLDTGPYGCLGNGLGYAIAARVARPQQQVVALFGDGAAGFSLMDVDTLVRHRLPVVMVMGNNGQWGLESHPMRAVYGWEMACQLQPECRYDEVVAALGGAGEIVRDPADIGPALDRAFAADVPYLVNVVTDPGDVYPRSSNLA